MNMGVLNKYGGDLMMTVFQSPQWGSNSKGIE